MELRDYQEMLASKGITILNKYMILYLTMQMRTGKTFTSFSVAERYLEYKPGRVSFITLKKIIGSIEDDYKEMKPCFNIHIFNYEQVKNNIQEIKNSDVIIIDEGDSLGQFPKPSNRTKDLQAVCMGKPIIYLSGTPTPESYSQIYHQFFISSFSPFKEHKTFYAWAKVYVKFKKKYFGSIAVNDYSDTFTDLIKEKINHLFLSYTQKEAGFKQEVQEKIHTVTMLESTYWLSNKLKKDRVFTGKDGSVVLADTNVKLMSKFHQIHSGTVILEDGNSKIFDMSKAEYIKQHFKGRKIAIYYKFKAEYMAILMTFGIDRLTEDFREFNKSEKLIFVSQVKSGSMGINLSTADDIVMFNIDFSARIYFQVRERMQEKDRLKDALLHWIFSDKGIERKVYSSVCNKKDYTLSYFRKDFELPKTTI